jgi:hypothetical protein
VTLYRARVDRCDQNDALRAPRWAPTLAFAGAKGALIDEWNINQIL